MQNAATEATYAQAQTSAAVQLQVSKDQFLRLNADFDNFRRRTVHICYTFRLYDSPSYVILHAFEVAQWLHAINQ